MKKYELVEGNKLDWRGIQMFRIRALVPFTTIAGDAIKVGDLGGWVENEKTCPKKESVGFATVPK